MSKILRFRSAKNKKESMASKRAEAARWLASADADKLTPAQETSLQVWLAADLKNAQAFYEAATLMDDLAMLRVLGPIFPLEGLRPKLHQRLLADARSWFLPKNLVWRSAVLTSLLLIFTISFVVLVQQPERFSHEGIALNQTLLTEMGENRIATLHDGSKVILNSRSRVDVIYTQGSRALILRYGEAQFDVAPNPGWPFLVRAGEHVFKALGTAFNIKVQDDGIELTVTHGVVSVDKLARASLEEDLREGWIAASVEKIGSGTSRISAGEKAKLSSADLPQIEPMLPGQIADKLAWQQGEIVFQGESLEQAIAEVNRYSKRQLVIVDERIRAIPIGGRFKIGEIVDLLDILEHGFGISATTNQEGRIELALANAP